MAGGGGTHPEKRDVAQRGVGDRQPFVHGGGGGGPGQRGAEGEGVDDGNGFVGVWFGGEEGGEGFVGGERGGGGGDWEVEVRGSCVGKGVREESDDPRGRGGKR